MMSTHEERTGRVRIRDLTGIAEATSRIALSHGIEVADPSEPGDVPYQLGAIVPRRPWRTPSAEELALLSARDSVRSGDDVLIVAVAPVVSSLHAVLERVPRDDCDAVHAAARSPEFRTALESSMDALLPYCLAPGGIHYCGPGVWTPGQRTTTVDYATAPARRVGLHVDSWDGGPARARALARRRICINAGESSRYFLFVPETVSSLSADPQYSFDEVGSVCTAFLSARSNAPIVRVRVDPGEAYIAGTENLIHDGSTEGASSVDLTVTFLGYFGDPDGDMS